MNEEQRDLWTAYGLMAVFIVAIGVCIGLLLTGCDGDVPGTGPTVTTSHEHLRAPFLEAIDVVGDSLQVDIGSDPALVTDVVLVDGASFSTSDTVSLWGRNQLVVTSRGPRCLATLALRVDASEVVPSGTSLAHEMAHCALDWQLAHDGQHENRTVWDWAVPRANEALRARGL